MNKTNMDITVMLFDFGFISTSFDLRSSFGGKVFVERKKENLF